ncbi:DUF3895 domain-containing protein [Paenibacillus sp. N4]|uniref:DUF3895 domain-containing protein n=1 Tax=Paenibacillus vietnamensis TaxID=2590547 RepID=UPI001CD0509A|nr:DUF3895 domain-containing protein [Paenibacillus vietnamensis]MCA0757114.1 DUF3895 domain-containing protein [Paenibacillus vietnamensis]
MRYELTIEQRDEIMGRLTEEQRRFIHHELVRGRRTLFARQLARKKCQFIPEEAEFEDIEAFIEEWDYIGFTDSGEVSPLTKCECGRSLRYQHQVMHIPTNTMRYFGIEHLQLHTGIDAKAISAIMKGFDVLDGEMNEILYKYREGWQLGQHVFLPLPDGLDIPADIQAHIDAGLPLLDRQLLRLRGRLRELDQADRRRRIAAAMSLNERSSGDETALSGNAAGAADTHDDEGQGAFLFNNDADGQGAFVFGDEDNGQGAFDFGDMSAAKPAKSAKTKPADKDSVPFAELAHGLDAGRAGASAIYAPRSSNPFHLPSSAQKVADNALKYGRISALAVSEFLIEQKLVQDVRMTTGKPDIYIAVAAYLDKLASEGKCELVAADSEDRVYSPLT